MSKVLRLFSPSVGKMSQTGIIEEIYLSWSDEIVEMILRKATVENKLEYYSSIGISKLPPAREF